MSDKPTKSPPAGATSSSASMPVYTEELPSAAGKISAIASASAPFVFFDNVPFRAEAQGIGMVTLTASRYISVQADGAAPPDHVVVAHLRASPLALKLLRDALDDLLRTQEQVADVAPIRAPH